MSLELQITADIKAAMLAKQREKLESLRAIKAAILLAKTSSSAKDELSDQDIVQIVQKLVKQRKESAIIYTEQNRAELAEKELLEASFMEIYLPQQLTQDELEAELKAIISELGVSLPSEMGKVMGVATKRLAGRADGRTVSATVKALLS